MNTRKMLYNLYNENLNRVRQTLRDGKSSSAQRLGELMLKKYGHPTKSSVHMQHNHNQNFNVIIHRIKKILKIHTEWLDAHS